MVTSFDNAFFKWKPEVESSISVVKLELSKLNGYFNRDAKWKPKVESSISVVKLELSKLNGYFNRDAKSASSQPGVLQIGF
jgi:hypothetical protein